MDISGKMNYLKSLVVTIARHDDAPEEEVVGALTEARDFCQAQIDLLSSGRAEREAALNTQIDN